mmetsp:Transcript_21447/g.31413  ORF Transcript_21447/g.31413 Transcript_21447/m.31413 type:complete len:456 (-) Transcript_21447:98-1465(-)
MKDAMEIGYLVLGELGEYLPPQGSAKLTKAMMMDQIAVLDSYTDEAILELNVMENKNKIAAMKFMSPMVQFSYFANMDLSIIITFHMITLSLTYGICKDSPYAFAAYGAHLCCTYSNVEKGYRFGKLAISLLDSFEGNDKTAKVYATVYGSIIPWREHMKLCTEPVMNGYNIGMRSGDVAQALVNALVWVTYSFEIGKPLAWVNEEMEKYCREMVDSKQNWILLLVLPFRQTVLNLMGKSSNPLKLTGDAMDQDKMLQDASEKNDVFVSCIIYFLRMWLAYIYGDYEEAAKMSSKSKGPPSEKRMALLNPWIAFNHVFYDCLLSIALARKTKRDKWKRLAAKAMERMRQYAVDSPENCQHKIMLMDAENAGLLGDDAKAAEHFDSAIALACENGFVQDQALAYERAGMFYLGRGEKRKASSYYDHAHNSYLKWGAQGKANHVRCRSLTLFMASTV